MAGNSFGEVFRVMTFGESHGVAIGAVIEGCPAGIPITVKEIQKELDRRKPGVLAPSSKRKEPDRVEILSGVFKGRTLGTPIALWIKNCDFDEQAYEPIKEVYRPGHGDLGYQALYGIRDHRGGGRASARETAARVAAGAIAKKFLSLKGIFLLAYTIQMGSVKAKSPLKSFDFLGISLDPSDFSVKIDQALYKKLKKLKAKVDKSPFRCADDQSELEMQELLGELEKSGDTIGGVVEFVAVGVPAGMGSPVFDRLNADLAKAFFSIPAVKGVEFGAGFSSAGMRGSEHNDRIISTPEGRIQFLTQNSGGTLGGISSGQPIIARIAFKPPSSVNLTQKTVNCYGKEAEITLAGRYDRFIPPRAVPVVEAMASLVLADHLLRARLAKI